MPLSRPPAGVVLARHAQRAPVGQDDDTLHVPAVMERSLSHAGK